MKNIFKIKGVKNFLEINKEEFVKRVEQIESWKKQSNPSENLGRVQLAAVKIGVLGEMLFAKIVKGEIAELLYSNWDVKFGDYYVDIKTLKTGATKDLSNPQTIKGWDFYVQKEQIKEDNVIYTPCLINFQRDEAIIIFNSKKQLGSELKKSPLKLAAPFNTKADATWNYISKYGDFY